jgi:hypothetical protein
MEKNELDDIITQLSIEYLLNNKKKYCKHEKKIENKDKLFYKKRIVNTTCQLIKENVEEVEKFPEIIDSFNHYIKVLIRYYKLIDKNDIIQSEYDIINTITDEENGIIENNNLQESNKETEKVIDNFNINDIILKKQKPIKNLDDFANYKKTLKEIIMPQKRKLNLKDPIYKSKGIINKKNNITNMYEEPYEKQKENNENDKNE